MSQSSVRRCTSTSVLQARGFCLGGDLGTTRAPRTPRVCLLSSLPTSRLSPGLVKTSKPRSGQAGRQPFPASRPRRSATQAHGSLQTADSRGKNRTPGRHTYMQICRQHWVLKISYLLFGLHIGPENPLYLFRAHLNSLRVSDPFTFLEECLASTGLRRSSPQLL